MSPEGYFELPFKEGSSSSLCEDMFNCTVLYYFYPGAGFVRVLNVLMYEIQAFLSVIFCCFLVFVLDFLWISVFFWCIGLLMFHGGPTGPPMGLVWGCVLYLCLCLVLLDRLLEFEVCVWYVFVF